ncbi:MAG: ion transporter [bacterium]
MAHPGSTLKQNLYTVIFGTETRAGRLFDLVLLYCILLSVLAVVIESIASLRQQFGVFLDAVEWAFTLAFTVEYAARIYCSPDRKRYVFSFFGIVDLVSIIPSYLALFVSGASYLLIIRLVRVLRIFRILKMARYLMDADLLMRSIWQSRRKIAVFFLSVLVLSTLFGSLMYAVEGPSNGFTSIPVSIYWTIVTITTVGYGDITPHTVLGQVIASLAMLTGYSIIAIPTGIITAELANEIRRDKAHVLCGSCGRAGHDRDASHCKWCGVVLAPPDVPSTD